MKLEQDKSFWIRAHAPFFGELIGRLGNEVAFYERLGAFYDENSERAKNLWITDHGSGEGAILRKLFEAMLPSADGHATIGSNRLGWNAPLRSTRLVLFEEPEKLLLKKGATGKLRMIRKHDQQLVHVPHKDSFQARIINHVVFFSAEEPRYLVTPPARIDSDRASNLYNLACHIIHCDIAPKWHTYKDPRPISEILQKEIPYISSLGLEMYGKASHPMVYDSWKYFEDHPRKSRALPHLVRSAKQHAG